MMKKYKAKGGGYGINNKFINYNYICHKSIYMYAYGVEIFYFRYRFKNDFNTVFPHIGLRVEAMVSKLLSMSKGSGQGFKIVVYT